MRIVLNTDAAQLRMRIIISGDRCGNGNHSQPAGAIKRRAYWARRVVYDAALSQFGKN
jgi:hypothetical protein